MTKTNRAVASSAGSANAQDQQKKASFHVAHILLFYNADILPQTPQTYAMVLRFSLLTALSILAFKTIGLLTVYNYVRLDYYVCLVAVSFLTAGYFLRRNHNAIAKPGQSAAPPPAAHPVALQPSSQPVAPQPSEALRLLSAKEWQVLRLVAEGKSNKEIAASQFIELCTVKTHLNNIYGKLSVANRKEARLKYGELAPKWPSR